jgi:hypothetical protein
MSMSNYNYYYYYYKVINVIVKCHIQVIYYSASGSLVPAKVSNTQTALNRCRATDRRWKR